MSRLERIKAAEERIKELLILIEHLTKGSNKMNMQIH